LKVQTPVKPSSALKEHSYHSQNSTLHKNVPPQAGHIKCVRARSCLQEGLGHLDT